MNPYLSDTMPELTEHELKSLGNYTISYYDKRVNDYVACKGSLYLFCYLTGLEDTLKNRDDICYQIGRNNSYSLPQKNETGCKPVTIYY